ncbi:MAG: hypothetical protein MHM6MM_005337 [Cercozoa sp. M6MM]
MLVRAVKSASARAQSRLSHDLQAVRGMRDWLPSTSSIKGSDGGYEEVEAVEQALLSVCRLQGYKRVHTPAVEKTSLFAHSLGTDTDVVKKELYRVSPLGHSTEEREEDLLTLRPEGTAPTLRAVLARANPLTIPHEWQRLCYSGDMFRHERPQKGRLRCFRQFGIELLATASNELLDLEAILLAHEALRRLIGQKVDTHVELQLNLLPSQASVAAFEAALRAYLQQHTETVSDETRHRLSCHGNDEKASLLRVLDSKDPGDRRVLGNAPSLQEFLSSEERQHLQHVTQGLTLAGVPFKVNNSLVRGLDYYAGVVFEFVACSNEARKALGRSQTTVLAGGRYDALGGMILGANKTKDKDRAVPAVGWAAGVDRLILLLRSLKACTPVQVQEQQFLSLLRQVEDAPSFSILTQVETHDEPPLSAMESLLQQNQHTPQLAVLQRRADDHHLTAQRVVSTCFSGSACAFVYPFFPSFFK